MTVTSRMLVRLRYVDTADFRKSEATNYRNLPAEVRDSLRDGEAVCFKSQAGDQIVFVVKPRAVGREASEVVCSVRLRLPSNRTWNPLMLAEYAASAGLELVGIKRLQDHLTRPRHAGEPEPGATHGPAEAHP